MSAVLLGKNGSGKTSFIEAIHFLNVLCTGTVYNNALNNIARKNKGHQKTLKNISKQQAINFLHSQEFNNPKHPIDFYICFIDAKKEIKLHVSMRPNGDIIEKIIEDGIIIVDQSDPIEKYKSRVFDIKFSKVLFVMLGEMEKNLPLYKMKNILKGKTLTKQNILTWIRLVDEKIIDTDMEDDYIDSFKIKGFDNETKKISWFQLSSGTNKWLNIIILILPALLSKQSFLFFDEIDRHLHPRLALFIIECFNNRSINKKQSQLLFTTHSPNIVDYPFRKDAINYIDENRIVNIAKGFNIREDISFSKNYYSQKLAVHPNSEEMFDFLESLAND